MSVHYVMMHAVLVTGRSTYHQHTDDYCDILFSDAASYSGTEVSSVNTKP